MNPHLSALWRIKSDVPAGINLDNLYQRSRNSHHLRPEKGKECFLLIASFRQNTSCCASFSSVKLLGLFVRFWILTLWCYLSKSPARGLKASLKSKKSVCFPSFVTSNTDSQSVSPGQVTLQVNIVCVSAGVLCSVGNRDATFAELFFHSKEALKSVLQSALDWSNNFAVFLINVKAFLSTLDSFSTHWEIPELFLEPKNGYIYIKTFWSHLHGSMRTQIIQKHEKPLVILKKNLKLS